MAPITLYPGQIKLTVYSVKTWARTLLIGLRANGISKAVVPRKPSAGANWSFGLQRSGPSNYGGPVSHIDIIGGSGAGIQVLPATPKSTYSQTTQARPAASVSGDKGGGGGSGGTEGGSEAVAPSAPASGASIPTGGGKTPVAINFGQREIENAMRTVDERKAEEKMLEQALAYAQMSLDPALAFHFEHHPSAQAIYDEAMSWLDADNKQHLHGLVVAFRKLAMDDNETCTEWFDRFRRAACELIDGGVDVPEQDAIELTILGAKHPRFYAL